MATDKSDDTLNLDALIGPAVIVDGQAYELLTPTGLPPLRSKKLARLGTRSDELVRKEESTAEEDAELDAIPRRMCRYILQAPDAVVESLTDVQAQRVIDCFFFEFLTLSRQEQKAFRLVLSNGSSQSSAPSTVATP